MKRFHPNRRAYRAADSARRRWLAAQHHARIVARVAGMAPKPGSGETA